MRIEYYLKIGFFVVLLSLGFVMYRLIVTARVQQKESEQQFFIKSAKKSKSYRLLALFNTLSKVRTIGRYLEKWRLAYEMIMPGNTRENKEMAMRSVLIMLGIDSIAVAIAIAFQASLYQIGCIVLTAYVITNEMGIKKFNKMDSKIIHDLDRFIDLVQFHFFNLRMVDEALLVAIQESKSQFMRLHGQKIYDVLLETDDIDEAIKEYNLTINNYYVKAFAESIFDTFIYGDQQNREGESKFVATLRSLKIDVREEQLSSIKLLDGFKGMIVVTLGPIYFLKKFEGVSSGAFASVTDLYNGSYGSIAMFMCFVLVFASYQVIIRLRQFKRVEKDNVELLDKLYRFKPIKTAVNTLCYRSWGKTLKLRENLRKIGSYLNEFHFTTKRVCFFILGFVLSIVLLNAMHVRNHKFFQTNMADLGSITSGASDEEALEMMMLGKFYVDKYKVQNIRHLYRAATGDKTEFFDSKVHSWLSTKIKDELINTGVTLDDESAFQMTSQFITEHSATKLAVKNIRDLSYKEALNSADPMVGSGLQYMHKVQKKIEEPDLLKRDKLNEKIAEKVADKLQRVDGEYFHWWEVILCFGIGIFFFYLPSIMMIVERKALQMDMSNEIIQFQTIILMLMDIPSMHISKILERMLMFSRIFESSIRKCINDMPLGEEDALEQLRDDEPFEPFANLIECMSMSDKVGIMEAFGGVAADRINYQKKRELEREISIANRLALKDFMLAIPLMGVLVLYLILPFIIASVGELAAALGEISQLG